MLIALAGLVCALATWAPSAFAGGEIAVQPNGKLVVAGGAPAGFGMLARLHRDGDLDSSFGHDGIAVDRDSPPFTELVLQQDGKIAALDAWMRLSRYGSDGRPDLGFGEDGVAVRSGILDGPSTLVLLPDGRIALGGHYHLKMVTHRALAYVYAGDGRSVEQVGELAPAAVMHALASRGDGSLLMAGTSYPSFQSSAGGRSVLARFVPGAGTLHDADFGAGAGLVTVPYPSSLPVFNALAPTPGGIYAAGVAANHIVAARFSNEAELDNSFGSDGFADAAPGSGFSRGTDLAVQSDGKLVVAGEARRRKGRPGYDCAACDPVVVRFLPDGRLDPSFGSGGIARLASTDGIALPPVETVLALEDGRILVAGRSTSGRPRVLVSRLMPNGRIDRSFGEAGVATVDACPGRPALQRQSGCLPSAEVRLRTRRLTGRRVELRLDIRPNLDWARVAGISVALPDRLRVVEARRKRIRASLVEEDGRRRTTRVALDGRELTAGWTIGPKSVSLFVPATALRWVGKRGAVRRLSFRVRVTFGTALSAYPAAGTHEVVLRPAWQAP